MRPECPSRNERTTEDNTIGSAKNSRIKLIPGFSGERNHRLLPVAHCRTSSTRDLVRHEVLTKLIDRTLKLLSVLEGIDLRQCRHAVNLCGAR